jgi:polysaccharide pyruvyl transferase WcaK-like protein
MSPAAAKKNLKKSEGVIHPAYHVFMEWHYLKEREQSHQEFIAYVSECYPELERQQKVASHHELQRRAAASFHWYY